MFGFPIEGYLQIESKVQSIVGMPMNQDDGVFVDKILSSTAASLKKTTAQKTPQQALR